MLHYTKKIYILLNASGYTIKDKPGPDTARSATSIPSLSAINPKTLNIAKPAKIPVKPSNIGTKTDTLKIKT